jgi:hypothetical protein
MRKTLRLMLVLIAGSPVLVMAQGSGQWTGISQCYINGTFVTVRGNCPASTGGGNAGSASAISPNVGSAFYQLGYQFGRWLFGSNSSPQAELQKQQMMAELQRRQAEAERQHREEEARRLAEMYNRLSASLKLSGLPNLRLKETASGSPELKLKLSDSGDGQAGVKGLPGIYLNEGKIPYGIPGLPGIYTGGTGEGSGLTNSKLALKLGDGAAGPGQPENIAPAPIDQKESQQPSGAQAAATKGAEARHVTESGLQLMTGASESQPAGQSTMFDPSKMTPQQLADVADQFSRLPPEEQQRLMAAAQNGAWVEQPVSSPARQVSLQASVPLKQQTEASQAVATALTLENSSARARIGFDQPQGPSPVQLGTTNATPSILRATGTPINANSAPVTLSTPAKPAISTPIAGDWVKVFLFPGGQSSSPFPRNPNPPLTNPLREEKKLQAELKTWDDWAMQRAAEVYGKPNDKLFPQATELAVLNTDAVKQYTPELLGRYNTDAVFRQRVDMRLQYATQHVALAYYQGLAGAHKAAIRAFNAELEKLAATGRLDERVSLEDQYRLHPERRQIVQSVWDRISADEDIALEKARADGNGQLDKEYQFVFQLIRGESAPQR